MKLRSVLFSSVAVAGLLLGAASISGARAAEVGSSAWNGFYIGVGGGGTASLSDIDATGYGETDFDFGDDASGSGANYDWNFDSDISVSGSADGDLDNIVVIGRGFDEGLSGDTSWDQSGGIDLLQQIFNGGTAGFTGQAQVGADFESNGFLLGLNGSFGFMNFKQKASASSFGDAGFDAGNGALDFSGDADYTGTTSAEVKFGNSMSVGMRAGFLGTPSTLLFASGGYTRQKVRIGANYTSEFDGDFDGTYSGGSSVSGDFSGSFDISSSNTEWANGFYVGGGVEQMFGENTSLKLEYRFTDLGSISTADEISFDSGDFSDVDNGVSTGVAARADLQTHAVMATLNFRF